MMIYTDVSEFMAACIEAHRKAIEEDPSLADARLRPSPLACPDGGFYSPPGVAEYLRGLSEHG